MSDNPIDQAKDATKKAQHATSNAMSMIGDYQRKLLEIAQANTQFAFEFGQALAAVRSPQDFMEVTSRYTQQRMEMFQKHSQELASLMKPPSF